MTSLRETLVRLEAEGRLTPSGVVEEARATPGSPLHANIFALDDEAAAEKYRLDRARRLIRSFRVVYSTPLGERRTMRQWTSIPTPQGREYVATEDVVALPLTYALVRQEMERDVHALVRKYAHLEEFKTYVLSLLDVS